VGHEQTIAVLGTGGTIAGAAATATDHVGYKAGQLPVQQLLAGIPSLAGVRVATEQVAQIDSKDMEPAVWLVLAERCRHWLAQRDVGAVVVTHGTDTLEETAYFLHRVLPASKPVVLTCAMRPATALSADGPQNIADAVVVARTAGARGVLVVCAGRVHQAVGVRKVHPYRLDAFSSGDAGVLGHVEDGRLRQVRDWPQTDPVPWPLAAGAARAWPRVEIVLSHSGAGGGVVDSLLRDGVQGLVVAGTGNGSVHAALEDALVRAMQQGIPVLRSTRCAEGQVVRREDDVLPATPLTPVQARVELMLQLLSPPA
jgi:L-asparaginase